MDISSRTARVYVGPSLKNGVLIQYTVFRGEFPPHVAALMEKSPSLKHLMVPTTRLSQARKEVATKGSLLNLYASKVRKEIEE